MKGGSRFRGPLRGPLRVAGVLLSVVLIAVLVQALRRDGPAALDAWRAAHVRWSRVVLAIICAAIGQAIYVVGWQRLLADSGIRAPLWQLARMFLVSNLGRYLPGGKAWQMAIVGMMAAEQQLPAAAVSTSSLFQGVVGVGVGAIVFVATGARMIGLSGGWLLLPLAAVGGLLAAPSIVRAIPRVHEAIKRHVPGIDSVTVATIWALVWTSAACWIMWGIALYSLASALLPTPVASIDAYIAAWTGSFLAGIIAIVSPAGLGAREGVMQAVLSHANVQAGDVLVVVAVARAWVTLLDIAPAVIVLLLRRRSNRRTVGDRAPIAIERRAG